MAEDTKLSVRRPQLQVTGHIREAAEKALHCRSVTDDLKKECQEMLQEENGKTLVSTTVLRDIYTALRGDGQKIFLHEIIKDAEFMPQTVSPPTRNPQLEARIQKLRIEQENKEYRRMTRNVNQKVQTTFTFQEEVKAMNRQLIMMINFLITVAAGFAFGYKGIEMMVGKVFAMQMMSGLIVALIVFFVDLYFLLRYGF
ncbi:unnamed protein product [Candidula unifasciata]|uniref:Transmembrane protein 199 n=1 Tax=Candidula unifasciata TaxID=100452 RepID=A0A8S3YEI9_9EUPU|nr:unnamed protein product [Candidula unifasciata]